MNTVKPYILLATILVVAGAIYFINTSSVQRGGTSESVSVTPRGGSVGEKAKRYELAKEITTPDGFINTDNRPSTISSLIGKKVILVDFWTYSCINCQRTTPYLNAWYEKYKDKGFVIVGVHTPEFEFEKEYDNVLAATKKFSITYPVVLDNDFSTWMAYKNRFWPHKYLIDIDGYIVYEHTGEGGYEETEKKIQEALLERMAVLGEQGVIDESITKEAPVLGGSGSPETYFGAARNEFFKNGTRGALGEQRGLTLPAHPDLNALYLSGDWNFSDEFAQNSSSAASIVYKYSAKDVFFVAKSNIEVIVEVLLDGKPLGSEAGADIVKNPDGKSVVKIKEARLYKIIENKQPGTYILELRISKPELKAFTFTFG